MTKRYGMVIDLSTCIGCQACVASCSMENQVPYWDGKFRTRVDDVVQGTFPDLTRTFVSHLCLHCEDAPCVQVCPTGATYKTPEGVVLVDQQKCVTCQACVAACQYDARYVYSEQEVEQAKQYFGEDTKHQKQHVDKCTLCYDRVNEGLEPACVATCPGGARIFGDWNDPESKVNKAMAAAGDRAKRLPGAAIAYIMPASPQKGEVVPPAPADPLWVDGWKGIAQPVAKGVLGTAVGVLAVATAVNLSQKKQGDEHDD